MRNCDEIMWNEVSAYPKAAWSWLLMSSFLYYCMPNNTPLLSDNTFDKLCKMLHDEYDTYPKHSRWSQLITKEMLATGSLYNLGLHEYHLYLCDTAIKYSRELEEK